MQPVVKYTQTNEIQAISALSEEQAVGTLSRIEAIIRRNSPYSSFLNPSTIHTSNSYEDLRCIAKGIHDRFTDQTNAHEGGWFGFNNNRVRIRELFAKIEDYLHPKFSGLSSELIGKIIVNLIYTDIRAFARINKFMYQCSDTAVEFKRYRFTLSQYNKFHGDLFYLEQSGIEKCVDIKSWGRFDLKKIKALSTKEIFEVFSHKKIYSAPYARLVQLLIAQAGAQPVANEYCKEGVAAAVLAINHAAESVIRLLILKGLDPNSMLPNVKGASFCLIECLLEANLTDNLELLLKRGAGIDWLDQNGLSPLVIACRKGNVKAAKVLLACGADPFLIDKYGSQPLHHAAQVGQVAAIRLLLEQGAPINSLSSAGKTPLVYSLESRNIEVFKLLLDLKADFKVTDHSGVLPLHRAAAECNKKAIELLLGAGADIFQCDNQGRNVISWACDSELGDKGFVGYLIELGPDPDLADHAGWTPFVYAAKRGHVSILKALIRHKVDLKKLQRGIISAQDWVGKSPQCTIKIARLYLKLGFDPNLKDVIGGNTPLHLVALSSNRVVVQMLISQGANVDSLNELQETPLTLACSRKWVSTIQSGVADTVKCLLDCGANVHLQDEKGNQAIHYAACHGWGDALQHLLRGGANVNAQNLRGETPLSLAAANSLKDVIRILLHHGADQNIANCEGLLPLNIALLNNFAYAVAQFQEFGELNVGRSLLNGGDHTDFFS